MEKLFVSKEQSFTTFLQIVLVLLNRFRCRDAPFFPKCMTTTATNVVGHDYKRFYDFFWSQQPRRRLPDVKMNLRTSWTISLSLSLSIYLCKKPLQKRNWVVNKIKAHFVHSLFVCFCKKALWCITESYSMKMELQA